MQNNKYKMTNRTSKNKKSKISKIGLFFLDLLLYGVEVRRLKVRVPSCMYVQEGQSAEFFPLCVICGGACGWPYRFSLVRPQSGLTGLRSPLTPTDSGS